MSLNIDENETGTHNTVFEGSERKNANHLQFSIHVIDWKSNILHCYRQIDLDALADHAKGTGTDLSKNPFAASAALMQLNSSEACPPPTSPGTGESFQRIPRRQSQSDELLLLRSESPSHGSLTMWRAW